MFHCVQVIQRRHQKIYLYHSDEQFQSLLRSSYGLVLVPVEEVTDAWELKPVIRQYSSTTESMDYIDCMESTWIYSRIYPVESLRVR